MAVLRFFEEIYNDKKQYFSPDESTLDGVVRLTFDLSPKVRVAVEGAKKDIEERCNSLSVKALQYKKYGKDGIKKSKLSPDALLQLAIQVGLECCRVLIITITCIDCLLSTVQGMCTFLRILQYSSFQTWPNRDN